MSKFDPQKHHRRSIRLQGYDYASAGAYFVTIVAWHRECLFGEVVNGEMRLNEFGIIADECWRANPEHFPHVELGAYVIMPNHVHGIIVIRMNESPLATKTFDERRGAAMLRPYAGEQNPHKINVKPGSLGAIVRSYKSAVSYRINKEHHATGIWQRNYGACPEPVEGNTSSVRIKTCKIKRNTSRQIRYCGNRMTKTRSTRNSDPFWNFYPYHSSVPENHFSQGENHDKLYLCHLWGATRGERCAAGALSHL